MASLRLVISQRKKENEWTLHLNENQDLRKSVEEAGYGQQKQHVDIHYINEGDVHGLHADDSPNFLIYFSSVCDDYNLCSTCERSITVNHTTSHPFFVINNPRFQAGAPTISR